MIVILVGLLLKMQLERPQYEHHHVERARVHIPLSSTVITVSVKVLEPDRFNDVCFYIQINDILDLVQQIAE